MSAISKSLLVFEFRHIYGQKNSFHTHSYHAVEPGPKFMKFTSDVAPFLIFDVFNSKYFPIMQQNVTLI